MSNTGNGTDEEKLKKLSDIMADIRMQEYIAFTKNLPKNIQLRIQALKKLQLKTVNLDCELHAAVQKLEMDLIGQFKANWERRQAIIEGRVEPTDEECDFPLMGPSPNLDAERMDEINQSTSPKTIEDAADEDSVRGIPQFWFRVLENCEEIGDIIEDHDKPILEHLTNVEESFSPDSNAFTLSFHFSPNDHFSNAVLTKTYQMKCKVDPENPWDFDGPEVSKCESTKIDWKEGKNVTLKQPTEEDESKKKEVRADSFFNFFDPPAASEQDRFEDLDEEMKERLEEDWEMGQFIRKSVIPRAVLYYTGEVEGMNGDDFEDDDEWDEDEDEDSDEEDEKTKKRDAMKPKGCCKKSAPCCKK